MRRTARRCWRWNWRQSRWGNEFLMKLRVAVLYGGRSGEHEISLRSAESIIAAMDPQRYEVERIFITQGRPLGAARRFRRSPARIPGSMWCFRCCTALSAKMAPCRGLLELADLPYVGAGVLGVGGVDGQRSHEAPAARARPAGGGICRADARRLTIWTTSAHGCRFRCSSSRRISARRWGFRR